MTDSVSKVAGRFGAMSSSARNAAKWVGLIAAVASALLAIEVGLIIAYDGHGATESQFPMLAFLTLFKVLWEQNSLEALRLLIVQPVFEVAHVDAETEQGLWRIYFYVPAIFIHMLVGAVLVSAWRRIPRTNWLPWLGIIASVVTLLVATTYVNLAVHCSGPTWLLDTALRVFQSPFNEASRFWEDKAITASTAFVILQWGSAAAALFGSGWLLFKRH